MHASIEQLLNLRDAAPEASDVADHVNGCQRCQAELGRLRIVQVGLQSLPEIPAPDGAWQAVSRARAGGESRVPMAFTGWFWSMLALNSSKTSYSVVRLFLAANRSAR